MTKTTLILFLCVPLLASQLVYLPGRAIDELEARGIPFTPDHGAFSKGRVVYLEDGSRLPADLSRDAIYLDAKRWAIGGYDRKTFAEVPVNWKTAYVGYHDYQQLTQALQSFQSQYPEMVRLETAGKSVQGRELWYVRVTDGNTLHASRPKFIYHANMHGDEVVGRELMLNFLEYLLNQYGKDEKVTELLSHAEIFIMPSMNPDGFELRTRENAHGKDLNRNFPDRFNSPNDTTEGREPEVALMMNLAKKHHFVYGINWHGGEICFNLPWGNMKNTTQNLHGDDSFFNPIGREYTEKNAPMYANHEGNFNHGLTYGYEWYPVNGGINDWFNGYRRSLHSVIELSVTKWPQASSLTKYWNDNRDAMVQYLWRGLRGVHLNVRGSHGEALSNVTIEIASLPKRPLTFDTGNIHRITGEGAQEITLSAAGYSPQTLSVSAKVYDGKPQLVTLVPTHKRNQSHR